MNKTKIEWTDYTSNPIRAERVSDGKRGHYCTKIGAGCEHCYSERWNIWLGNGLKYTAENADKIRFILNEKELLKILRTRKTGIKIFIGDMTDIFHPGVPFEFIDDVFAVAALCPQHTFQILTKRPERMLEYFSDSPTPNNIAARAADRYENGDIIYDGIMARFKAGPLPNVWLGTSASTQPELDKNVKYLLQCPAAVRFVSLEPLLGPVELELSCIARENEYDDSPVGYVPCSICGGFSPLGARECHFVDWVIVGGETGPGAKPMYPNWVRSVRDDCQAAGVPFFFKQWGAWLTWTEVGEKVVGGGGIVSAYIEAAHGVGWDSDPPHFSVSRPPHYWDEYGAEIAYRIGKKAAGRLLDGREWNEMPKERSAISDQQSVKENAESRPLTAEG